MAQKRFFEYLSDDKTFDLNIANAGIFPSGLYCGFDTVSMLSASEIEFSHGTTGFQYIQEDGQQSPKNSVILTNQGVKVWHDSPVNLQITPVISNYRIDAIVLNHIHAQTEGGIYATLEPIEGSTTYPVVPQGVILLGYLKVYPNSVIWERLDSRKFGGLDIKKEYNVWEGQNLSEVKFAAISGGAIDFRGGNIFKVGGGTIDFIFPTKTKITNLDQIGTVYTVFAEGGDISITDIEELKDQGYVNAPNGLKWIDTMTASTVLVKEGGYLQFIELADHFQLIGIFDRFSNTIKNSRDLVNKQLWYLSPAFRSSVREVVRTSVMSQSLQTNAFIVEASVVKVGTAANLANIVMVSIPQTESNISEIEIAYPLGTEITLFFTGRDAIIGNGQNQNLLLNFKTFGKRYFASQRNKPVKCIQTANGLCIIDGDVFNEFLGVSWVGTPPTNSARNGNLKYCFLENGQLAFDGDFEVAASGEVDFTIPKEFFGDIFSTGFYRSLTVQGSEILYGIDGNNVKFSIGNTTQSSIVFNFSGISVRYK